MPLSLSARFPRFFVISAHRRSQLHAARVDSCCAAIYGFDHRHREAPLHQASVSLVRHSPSPSLSLLCTFAHRGTSNDSTLGFRHLQCLGIRLTAATNEGHRSLRDPSTTPISSATDDFVRNRRLPPQPVEAAAPQVQEHGTIQFVSFHRRVQSNTASSLVRYPIYRLLVISTVVSLRFVN
ncbi:hypothetical protein I3843_07G043400 [Carya illinoinensis]|uniref:Uncharacterized protein n=1 Tax=Carya illinoinensis TaxID=32201 RepID=A0A922EHB1_CARIL|nr:hypothetical protein I3760_07G043400 [Carya illinoinensis]KAG6702627.1 hypothetical protein I3842_07G044900 [Carya illinoinensis]KAG7969673.1 hypothetical protein I3843_07G043400 [Carya illinoinensis]